MIRRNKDSKVPPTGDGLPTETRKPGVPWLSAMFLVLSAALSVVILGVRNLFDDEIVSLPFITRPVSGILEVTREGDVHPPGMYLLAHAAWSMVPSYRWLNLLPWALMFAGLAIFVLSFTPRLRGWAAMVCVLMLACLHPELLMWSNTLRWYCPWTGLALMTLVLFLQPRRSEWRLGWVRGVSGVLLLAGMFYLNYITLLFVAALLPAVWLRIRASERRAAGKRLGMVGVAFVLLATPQVRTMLTVHLPNSRAQRSNVVIAALRLMQALTGSEAFLPWNAVAVVATVALGWMFGRGVWLWLCEKRVADTSDGEWRAQRALVLFGVGFALLVVATGLGGKPRNAMLLVPVFAPAAGIAVERLGWRVQWLVVAALGIWVSVGAAHLVGRFGLQKSNMNDRPEEVVRLIARGEPGGNSAGMIQGCALAVTYDSGAAFALAQARVPGVMILSPYRGSMFEGTLPTLPRDCARPQLYVVQSYRSGEPDRDWKYIEELDRAKAFIQGTPDVERLSRDPDAPMKRRLSTLVRMKSGASLPDYRFVVFSGEMDGARLPELRQTLHYFVSGEEVVPD